MALRFLAGLVTGGVVSVLGLAAASLLGEQPPGNAPPAPPQVDAPDSVMGQDAGAAAPVVPAPGGGDGPSLGPAPAAETPARPAGADTDTPATGSGPAAVPSASGVQGAMRSPETEDRDAPQPGGDDPVRPDTQAPSRPGAGQGDRPRAAGNGAPADPDTPAADDRRDDPAAGPGADAPDVSALQAYAAPAPDPNGRPVMAIVLIDDGRLGAGPALVSGLAFPVTVAIDPAADGAAERLAAYRDAGIEAVLRARLPEGAAPQDVGAALQDSFADLSQTVALLDLRAAPPDARAATDRMMQVLAAAGRGYLARDGRLNTAALLAARAGVPAATIHRDLDGAGQDARTIRRSLEQASVRARRDGNVVLLCRVRPDTVTALINWGNDKRAAQVAQVPLSAVLRGDE